MIAGIRGSTRNKSMVRKAFIFGSVILMLVWLLTFGASAYLSAFAMSFSLLWLLLNLEPEMIRKPAGQITHILIPVALLLALSAGLKLNSSFEVILFLVSGIMGGLLPIAARHFGSET